MLRVLQSQPQLSQLHCHSAAAPPRPEIVEEKEASKNSAPVEQFPISSSKSCPPGPWLPGAAVSTASTASTLQPTLAPPSAGAKHNDKSKSTMISSYSVTQRLNNQLSLEGGNGSASGHPGHSGHNYMPIPRAHPGTTPTYENSINPTSLSQPYQVESQVTI